MSKKRFIIFLSAFLLLSFIVYSAFTSNKTDEINQLNDIAKINDKEIDGDLPNFLLKTSSEDTLYVSIIGDEKFPVKSPTIDEESILANDFIYYLNVDPKNLNDIDEKSRFVIVPVSVINDDNKQSIKKQIEKWITDKRSVLLYDNNLNDEIIKDIFGEEYSLYKFESSQGMKYPLYGIGYSVKKNHQTPVFLVVNGEGDNIKGDITSFLLRNHGF